MSHEEEPVERFQSLTEEEPSTPQPQQQSESLGVVGMIRNTQRKFSCSAMPLGFFQASGEVVSSAPTISDIQNGNLDSNGWSGVAQRRNSTAHKETDYEVLNRLALQRTKTRRTSLAIGGYSQAAATIPEAPLNNAPPIVEGEEAEKATEGTASTLNGGAYIPHDPSVPYPNGYQFPPKHTKMQSIQIGLKAYWRFLWTPFGFLLTVYSLNVVAWGGMLFLVLIGGAPAMCPPNAKYSCNDKHSTKNVWIENDSQIVNALFCVTGLGLIPWRFRDLYYLMKYRIWKDPVGLRRLAGINRSWFRLEESQTIDVHWEPKSLKLPRDIPDTALAYPLEKNPDPPLTGERAPPTKVWKLDFYIWCYVWNTFFQIMLCGVMWGLNRWDRPAWTTGCLIPVACLVAAAGGIVTAKEGSKVKKIEGVPVSEEDLEILRQMREHDRLVSGGETGQELELLSRP